MGSMRMVKWLAALLAGALIFSPGIAFAQDQCSRLIFTGHPDYAPIAYRDGEGLAGAGVDMIEEIGARLGIEAVASFMGPWGDAQQAAFDGDADIILGLYITEARAAFLDFVDPPFAINPEVVIVPAGRGFEFSGPEDLVGRMGVTLAGESFGVQMDRVIAERLDVARVERLADAFEMLLGGEADYLIFGLYPTLAEAARAGVLDRIEALSPNLVDGDLYIAFSKRSACLEAMDVFGAEIEVMLTTGRFAELLAVANEAWDEALGR